MEFVYSSIKKLKFQSHIHKIIERNPSQELYLCVDSQLGEDISVFLFNSSCIFQEHLQFQLARVLDLDEQVLDNYPQPC